MLRKFLVFSLFKLLRRLKNPLKYVAYLRKLTKKVNFIYLFPKWASRSLTQIADIPCEWIQTENSNPDKIIFYMHGGAFILGLNAAYYLFAAELAKITKTSVLLIDYRLAPENPHPAALEDCLAVYQGLLAQGFDPGNIVFMGDSAGGGLTLATLLSLKENKQPLPAAGITLSAWLDLSLTGESLKSKQLEDPLIYYPHIIHAVNSYIGNKITIEHPLVSPFYGDPRGLPPLFMQVGTREILWDDTIRFAEKAQANGINVIIEKEEGMVHVHPLLFPKDPKSILLLKKIKSFIEQYI